MSGEPVALLPQCEECRLVWLPADEDRWRAYLTIDDEISFYCPKCADREFDDNQHVAFRRKPSRNSECG